MIGRIQERVFSQSLASSALSETVIYGEDGTVKTIYLKFSVATTETITITRVSRHGATYDIILDTKSLADETSYIFHPEWEVILKMGDSIKIQCTNANVTGTVYGLCHFEGGVNE